MIHSTLGFSMENFYQNISKIESQGVDRGVLPSDNSEGASIGKT